MVQKIPRFFYFVSEKELTYRFNLTEANFLAQTPLTSCTITGNAMHQIEQEWRRLNSDFILSVIYAYQFHWCQFFCNNYNNHCENSIPETFPLFSFKSSHSVGQKYPHILSMIKLLYIIFLGLKLQIGASGWHFTVYRSTFVKVVTYFHFFFFSAMMYNKCDVFVCGHKWKCNSTEMDSLFSFHKYYRALHPYVPFHFLYFISVCWCSTVSWMQDRYCTKLYCYWLKNVIKSCLRSVFVLVLNLKDSQGDWTLLTNA